MQNQKVARIQNSNLTRSMLDKPSIERAQSKMIVLIILLGFKTDTPAFYFIPKHNRIPYYNSAKQVLKRHNQA